MSKSNISGKSIGIILPYLNEYRIPFLFDLREHLADRGVELFVAAGIPIGVDASRGDAAEGFPVLRTKMTSLATRFGVVNFRVPPREVANCSAVIVEHAVKNLDSHFLLGRPRRNKVALWGHGRTITKDQARSELLVQKAMVMRADWYFGYTAGSVDRAVGLGMDRKRCTEVMNTVDTERLRSARDHWPREAASSTEWVALYVGGLDESKRIEFLVESARRIHASDPRFRLKIVGNGSLRPLIEQCRDEEWCLYLGGFPLADEFQQVADSQVILMPGRVGLAAVDSFAIATPIVTTQWDWHAPEFEYLNDGNSVTTQNSVDEYVAAVLGLMADSRSLTVLQAGSAEAGSHYSIADMARNFGDGCAQLLSSPRKALL